MALSLRSWSLTGNNKASSSTLTISTLTGTAYPQVGDLLVVGWVADNLSASTPTLSSIGVGAPGSVAASTRVSATDATATAGGDVINGYGYCLVTTALGAASTLVLQFSGSITAKAATAVCLTGGTTLADYGVISHQAPTAGSGGSIGTNVLGANEYAIGATVSQSATPPTITQAPAGSWVANTSGAGAATNAAIKMCAAGPSQQLSIGAINDGIWILRFLGAGGIAQTKTPADTAAGSDDATFVFAGPPALKFPETFTYGLPRDIDIITMPPDPQAGVYPVTIDATRGNPAPAMLTSGNYQGWRGKEYTRWHIQGGFVYTFDINFPVARDIYECMFWSRPNSADPVNGTDGFGFRVQSGGGDGGFFRLTNNQMTHIGPNQVDLPGDQWWRVEIKVTGTVATATVTRLSDMAIWYTPITLDLAPWIDAEHPTEGVFGQFWAPLGPSTGIVVDNIDLVGIKRVRNFDDVVYADQAVNYWPMDDSDGTWLDWIGNLTATILPDRHYLPAQTPVAGGLRNSVYNQVNAQPTPELMAQTPTPAAPQYVPYTYEYWWRVEDANMGLISPVNAFANCFSIEIWGDGLGNWANFTVWIGNGAGQASYGVILTDPIKVNQPNQLVVTVTATTWTVYSNGKFQASGALSANSGIDPLPYIYGPGHILRWPFEERVPKGWHGPLVIYSKALTAYQVQVHYDLGLDLKPPAALEENPADYATGSDAVTVLWTRGSSAADTAAGSDALTVQADRVRVVADGATGADAVVVAKSVAVQLADVAGGTDAAGFVFEQAANVVATPTDTAAGSDSVSTLSDAARPVADSAAGSDSAVALGARDRSASDLAAGSDARVEVWDRVRPVADLATGGDNVTVDRSGAVSESLTDVAGGLDTVDVLAVRTRGATDVASGTDAVVTVLDRATASDNADLAAGADSLAVLWTRDRTVVDIAVGSDSAFTPSAGDRLVADTAAGSDAVSVVATRDRVADDSAMGTETLDVRQGRALVISDLADGSDAASLGGSRSRTVADVAGGLDEATKQQAGSGSSSANDQSVGDDTATATATRIRSAADLASGSDSVTLSRGGSAQVADVATAQDLADVVREARRIVIDAALGADDCVATYDRADATPLDDQAAGSDDALFFFNRRVPMTLEEMLALLPDNDTGQIDANDLRTIVTELYYRDLDANPVNGTRPAAAEVTS